ncbi:hypothetical protein K9M18_05775 [Candidatus Woesearchaeota archaeon]|nr:hypothetical protein [Candidatus Woesearchaeota archaeon]
MKLTNTHKIIIGIVGLGIVAYATKKYWMPKKKTTSTTPTAGAGANTQSAPTNDSSNEVVLKLETKTSDNAVGNATREDEKDQKYRLLSDFESLDTKSMKMINLKKGDIFINKKGKGNYIYMNKQASMDVYDYPNEKIIVGIPYNILGKIN